VGAPIIAGASSASFFEESAVLIAALFGAIQRYLRYRSLLLSIENLDDRILSDIGLNRGELSAVAWNQVERATAH
jgi:uncharacterized protein YjiS (DUF1127 family)